MFIKKIKSVRSTPKAYVSILASSDDVTRQTYNVATGEYYPDRTLVPLVLKPLVGYRDADTGKSVTDAAKELTGGRWYRIDPTKGGGLSDANLIAAPEPPTGNDPMVRDFYMKGTLGDPDYGTLIVRENVTADNPVTYVFVGKLAVGNGIEVKASYRSETESIESAPVLYFDNVKNTKYNPWEDYRYFDITPHIAGGLAATFKWESFHGTTWGALGSTCYDWAIKQQGDGIRIDRSLMQSMIKLRCTATVAVGGGKVQVTDYVTHSRVLPAYKWTPLRIGEINPSIDTLSPLMFVEYGRKRITSDAEIAIKWYGGDTTATLIGTGFNPQFKVSALGRDGNLGANVTDRGGYATLLDSDGSYLIDGSDGKQLLVKEND